MTSSLAITPLLLAIAVVDAPGGPDPECLAAVLGTDGERVGERSARRAPAPGSAVARSKPSWPATVDGLGQSRVVAGLAGGKARRACRGDRAACRSSRRPSVLRSFVSALP